MSKKVIWLDRDLVKNPLYLGVCKNEKAFTREMKRLNIKKNNRPAFILNRADATVHYFEKENKVSAIVCLDESSKKCRTKAEIMGLITHEAVHVWQEIKSHIREQLPSPEFEAYSIQMIAQRIYEAYNG